MDMKAVCISTATLPSTAIAAPLPSPLHHPLTLSSTTPSLCPPEAALSSCQATSLLSRDETQARLLVRSSLGWCRENYLLRGWVLILLEVHLARVFAGLLDR